MGDRTSTLTAVLVDAVSGPAKRIQAEITGIGTTVGTVGSLLQGIGQGIGQSLFFALSDSIRTVTRAIPDLLDRGHDYLDQLHQIQLQTGMTAEQTSALVGTFQQLGVPTEALDVLFARLGSNLAQNEPKFRALGIATRNSNGGLLDSYQIIQNVRRAVSEHGSSLLSTAAAQELFGRSGYKIIEALQASDPEWNRATENVRRWGGILSQQAIAGADALGDTLSGLQAGITAIGANIAAAVDPFLRAFVDSFASFVQAHLQEIVNFAVAVVNTITGFISGLFGITSAVDAAANGVAASTVHASSATDEFGKVLKKTAGGADAFTISIQAQIKAIDAQAHAIEQAAERRRAVQERARLQESLAAAQAQLADLKGNAPFLGGLSGAEQALAVQKHAQDIIDAEKNVRDARQSIGDFEADQKDRAERELLNRQKQRLQERLAAHKAADADILQSGLRMDRALDADAGGLFANLGIRAEAFGATAAASFQTGIDAARGFLDVLLGTEKRVGPAMGGGFVRSGGVVGALGSLATVINGLVNPTGLAAKSLDELGDIARFIANADPFGWLADELTIFLGQLIEIREWISRNLFGWIPNLQIPGAATGAFVPASPGGTIMRIGEGGQDEWVLNESQMARLGGGGLTVIVNADFLSTPSDEQIRSLTDKISRRLAFQLNNTPVTSLPSGTF